VVVRGYAVLTPPIKGHPMATGGMGFDDVTFDPISVPYHSLKAGP
jgi:hypothetical protein